MSKAMTVEEMRQAFIDHCRSTVDYWAGLPAEDGEGRLRTTRDRLSGAMHTILSAISGRSQDMPSFNLVPTPHPDDRAYRRKNGDDWWVGKDINDGNLNWHLYNNEYWKMKNIQDPVELLLADLRTKLATAEAALEAAANDIEEGSIGDASLAAIAARIRSHRKTTP